MRLQSREKILWHLAKIQMTLFVHSYVLWEGGGGGGGGGEGKDGVDKKYSQVLHTVQYQLQRVGEL